MRENITIYDIAKESGVSVSTVSRVLNNSNSVSDKTRKKVQDIMDKYKYTPNSLARGLMNKKTMTIGVILPDITNPYFASLFLQIQRYALMYNYSIILCNTLFAGSSHGYDTPFNERDYFNMMLDKQVDAVLITGGQIDKEDVSKEFIQDLNKLNESIPVVIIGQSIKGCNCHFIERNLTCGVSTLVQHLSLLGHKRLGFIGGEIGVNVTTARVNAFKKALASLSLPCDDNLIVLTNYYAKDGYEAMNKLLHCDTPNPTAVIAINDMVARGAIRAIYDNGLSVPGDIAVVSCDQFPDSDYLLPRLTTIDQMDEYLGKIAITKLISAINGISENVSINHTPELVVRESCGFSNK